MKYYRDTKLTIWHRTYWEFPDEMAEEDALEAMNNLDCPDSSEYLYDTVEELTVKENDGFATVETYNENNEIIAANGKY
jgi:hypothetical protein